MFKYFYTILSLLFLTNLQAQEVKPLNEILYADAKVGAIIIGYGGASQVTASIGYRFTDKLGLGIGYHNEYSGSGYESTSFKGIGIDYRNATYSGFILKAGGGLIYRGGASTDDATEYRYTGGGWFTDYSIDYHFRWGVTIGAYFSYASGMKFDHYVDPDNRFDNDNLQFDGEEVKQQIGLGITIGLAIPGRKRRN